MRTPDSAAGKKGRCPHCGELTRIPETSQPSASESDRRLAASATVTSDSSPAAGKTSDRIEFPCPKCGRPVRTPGAAAGKKGKCPNCGATVQIPLSSKSQPQRKAGTGTSGAGAQTAGQAAKRGSAIEFPCPQCQKLVRTPASAAGKKGKCPKCGAVLKIPAGKTSSARGPKQRTAGLAPLPDTTSGLTPIADDAPGLMPLGQDEPGLTPLADDTGGLVPLADDSPGLTVLPEDSGGLTPLPDTGGLTPLGGDTGLVPLDEDPLGTPSPGTSPFPAGGAADPNPFSDIYAPAAAPAYSQNPYQAPAYASRGRQRLNEWVVKAPAIAMMVVGGLNMLVMVPYLLISTIGAANAGAAVDLDNKAEMIGYGVGVVIVILFVVVFYGLILFGAFKMLKMESWGLALTAAILMVVPCTMCWMGLPFGIWAIVVLSLSDVRQAFA